MRYYVLPLFGEKTINNELLDLFKRNTNLFLNDDLIVGFYQVDKQKTISSINKILNFYNIESLSKNATNFIELSDDFIHSINSSNNLDTKEKLSIILTYFMKFGLTIKPIKNKNEELNKLFFISKQWINKDFNWWFENLILLENYYNPITNSPFTDEEIKDFLALKDFRMSQELIIKFI